MVLLLLACVGPSDKTADDTGGDPTDTGETGERGETGESGDSGDTAETGASDGGCPPWSGLTPGVTRTLETLPGVEEASGDHGTWTETTVRDGDTFVYERLVETVNVEGTTRMRSTATFRCDAEGAWLLGETEALSSQPVVGEPSASEAAWTWTSDFLYFPRELESGLRFESTQTALHDGSDSPVEVTYTFVVVLRADRDTVLGTLSAWEVELWDTGLHWFADPQGRVASYPYELVSYVE